MKTGLSTKKAMFFAFMTYVLCSSQFFSVYAIDEIPDVIPFAGMNLQINQVARKQIKNHVDFLLKRKHQIKSNMPSIDAYLSVVGEILEQKGLPQDYKYLALQENQLYTDFFAGNHDGFWKLNSKRAREIGLEINDRVDERFNLVISTERTSEYLKQKNLYFKNWIFTMLTLKLGYQKTKTYLYTNYTRSMVMGAKNLSINEDSHPFIRKFIAQKILFEKYLKPEQKIRVKLIRYTSGANKTLPQIARKFNVAPEVIKQHNPWLKKRRIPSHKVYPVMIPEPGRMKKEKQSTIPQSLEQEIPDNWTPAPRKESRTHFSDDMYDRTIEELQRELLRQEEEYRREQQRNSPGTRPSDAPKRNLPMTHTVLPGQDLIFIARYYGVSIHYLRRLNNLRVDEDVFEGQLILIQKIHIPDSSPRKQTQTNQETTPDVETHLVSRGETLFGIARRYNLSVTKLRLMNKLESGTILKVGQVLIIRKNSEERFNLKTASPDSNADTPPVSPKKREDPRIREKILNYSPDLSKKVAMMHVSALDKLSPSKKISMYFRR